MWVTDPGNSRLSAFDTAGAYVRSVALPLGCFQLPWPGRFDASNRYITLEPPDCVSLTRFDEEFRNPTRLVVPASGRTEELFAHNGPGGPIEAEIPFQGSLSWQVGASGTTWALITDECRLFELDATGDTLRSITRAFTPEPLTEGDRELAAESLEWFIAAGGRIDESKLPRYRPPVIDFFQSEDGELWVERYLSAADFGRVFDRFDADGRFVDTARLPFALSRSARPVITKSNLYAVTEDEAGVQFLVRARLVAGASSEGPRQD